MGIELPSPTQNYTLASKHHYSGSVQIDDTISEARWRRCRSTAPPTRASARCSSGPRGLHRDVGLRESARYPASGPCTPSSRYRDQFDTVAIDFSHLDFGRIGVPSNVVDTVKTTLDGYLTGRFLEAGSPSTPWSCTKVRSGSRARGPRPSPPTRQTGRRSVAEAHTRSRRRPMIDGRTGRLLVLLVIFAVLLSRWRMRVPL